MMNSIEPAHILIVDDDALLRSMAAKTLLHAGFAVSEAASGEEGLRRFSERRCDLILLDVIMTGVDGYEMCHRVRALPDGAGVPILMLTGLNDTAAVELAFSHGATDFIAKPLNWALLSHKVRYALRSSAAAEAMRRSRERLARAQSLAGMGNWTLLPDGRIETSAELLRLFGLIPDAGGSMSAEACLQLVIPADRNAVSRARSFLLTEGTPYQLTFRIRRGDGVERTLFEQAAPVQAGLGHPASIEGITQDITDRVQAEERIQQLAHYDAITGLPNRQFFAELAGPWLERASRNGYGCAVMHMDIDRFKGVNDAFGRGQGDVVLKTVADRLRSLTRTTDLTTAAQGPADRGVLASVGGNSYTLLITDLARQDLATLVAQRLLRAIAQPIMVESQSLVLTASIGIAFFPNDAQDFPGLARCAEQAAYAAKDAGRAQHRFFDEKMNARAASRLRLEADLSRAIEQGELRLHFQPKVDASSGAIVGAEALVRWQHRERGLIPPAEFIGVAEESGLILALTDWVLNFAGRTLRDWADAGLPNIPMSVNLAAPSLTGQTLVTKLDALLRRFNLKPRNLMLELTETVLMRDIETGVALLQILRDRGYGLSLDDFGTGYSSLSYLQRLPLDELKIDRAFVTNAAAGGRDGALAAAIVALGRELKLNVVAEGVETREQSAFFLQRGCNVQQGYLFSKPIPAAAFVQLLRTGRVEHATEAPGRP
jgi:diguanylate cyclase (GGDEF)-like protein/PAS domain S-box-containing protein